jgi:hypothetical protein
MRLPKQIFIGMIIFAFSTIGQATSTKPVTEDAKSDMEFPIVEPGTRLFAGETDENEFYILGKNQPTPVIQTAAKKTETNSIVAAKSLLDLSTHQALDMFKQFTSDIALQYTPVENVDVKPTSDS